MQEVDIAIVGGGVAGTYSAWRLKQAHPQARIVLLEASSRIGGRLHSLTPEGMPSLRAEIGGMRFPSFHRFALNLIDTLGLETREFKEGNANNLFYLRGRRLKGEDFAHSDRVPYWLREDEQGVSPPELLKRCLQRLSQQSADFGPAELEKARRGQGLNGQPLHELGFLQQLMQVASFEALQLIEDAGGYYTAVGNTNASDTIYTMLCHRRETGVHFRTLKEGLQALPVRLASEFQRLGGEVRLQHALVGLPRPEGRVVLRVRAGETIDTLSAGRVILAMPRRSLELLLGRCYLFQIPQFVEDLQQVSGQPASKLFLCFDHPWWSALGLESGRSDTDLPMRQCYYFGTEGDQPGADPATRRSLLMAGYNDGKAVSFWQGFVRGGMAANALLESELPVHHSPVDELEPSSPMVEESCRQLSELHQLEVPRPYASYFVDWMTDPYGGAWHSWRVGARSWEVMPRMRQPDLAHPIYICGEAYSLDQGWVEGALNTAEHVLEEKFGLSPPPFLPEGQFFGP